LFISTNNGEEWFLSNLNLSGGIYHGVMTDKNNVLVKSELSLFISTDDGTSWGKIFDFDSNRIYFSYIQDGLIFLNKNDVMSISSDYGNSWTDHSLGDMPMNFSSLLKSGNNFFLGNSGYGFYVSSDNCNSWVKKNSGLSNLFIESIAKNDEYIFLGTESGSVYRAKVSDLTGVDDNRQNYETNEIFPNPSSSIINFQIPNKNISGSSCYITNLYGNIVKDINYLQSNCDDKGNSSIDVSDLPNGVYFMTITLGNKTESRKFVVIH
jgi:hypothetical protein